jgi:solute carrier family 25 (mitochondrial carrier protein), member 16
LKCVFGPESAVDGWPWRKLLAGSLAGALAVSVTYPFDIIRARIAYDIAHHKKYLRKDVIVFKTIVNQLSKEGSASQSKIPFRGFYQGFLPTILGIIPYAGVSFFVFESSKQYLRKLNDSYDLSPIQIFTSGLFAGAIGQTVAYPFDVIRRRMQLYRITEHLPAHHYDSGIKNAIKYTIKTHGWMKGVFSGLSINYIKVAPASGVSFLVYETLKNKFPEGLI